MPISLPGSSSVGGFTLPGIKRDVVTIARYVTTADTEGNWNSTTGTPVTVMGMWGNASDSEVQAANTRGETVDAVVAVPTGTVVAPGDRVTVRGETWVVVGTRNVRFHLRVMLRETT